MLRAISVVAIALPLIALCGCNTVTVEQPFGEPVTAAEGRKLDGMWNANGKPVHLKCVGEGRLIFGVMEWDEKTDHFKSEEIPVLLRQVGDMNFALIAPPAGEEPRSFHFMRYELADGNNLKVWQTNVPAFAAAVEKGELPGEVKKSGRSTTVRLTATEEQLAAFFAKDHEPPLFEESNDSPTTTTRVILPGAKGSL